MELSPANTCVEDEWTNLSTIVPYTAVLDSAPALQEKQKKGPTMDKRNKDPFITRLVNSLVKLERKYAIPPHKRKARMFTRRPTQSSVIPIEFNSIYHDLAAPDPEPVTVPEPYLTIAWQDVRFKPSLPDPKEFPILSASADPKFYQMEMEDTHGIKRNIFRQTGKPFGTLPGYETNLGVAAIPTLPVGGYVYSTETERPKWVLYATRGGTSPGGGGAAQASSRRSRRQGG